MNGTNILLDLIPPNTVMLTTEGVAEVLGCSPSTVIAWRRRGGGPKFCKLGNLVRYPVIYLREYILSHVRGTLRQTVLSAAEIGERQNCTKEIPQICVTN